MTWVKFLAAPEDLVEVMRFVYAETDCRVFEAYSIPDQRRREFATLESVVSLFENGSPHLVLWSPSVGAPPVVRRVVFTPRAVPGHTHRYVTEGCSLITLLCGSQERGVLDASRFAWWTEASARRKADPSLAAEKVDWPALTAIGVRLRSQVCRILKRATAGNLPVLGHALSLARGGVRLRDPSQPMTKLELRGADT